jgi:SAM-dependent methyltransferase
VADVRLPGLEDPANVVHGWDEAHRLSPAPRHRRRLVLDIVRRLPLRDCLDAGCGQPYLLEDLQRELGLETYGCDLSERTVEDSVGRPVAREFRVLDLAKETWPGRSFDLVICSEVLEHIPDWRAAVANLARMARRYIVITVPTGKVRAMDRMVGHTQHFAGPELIGALRAAGCRPLAVRRWGFPFHSLYRIAISSQAERVYDAFGASQGYGAGRKAVSEALYRLFFLNDLFRTGDALIVLAAAPARDDAPEAAA